MKTSQNCIVGLALAALFLVATSTRADILNWFPSEELYMQSASTSDWVFGPHSFVEQGTDKGVKYQKYEFNVTNAFTGDTVLGTMVTSGMNGWGGTGQDALGFSSQGSMLTLGHNTAHEGTMSFKVELDQLVAANFVDTFFIRVGTHDSSNGGVLTVTAKASNGEFVTKSISESDGGFFGFSLSEGYFTEIIVSINGGKPNGGFEGIQIGFGNGITTPLPPVSPEPTTLAILGLGLAGVGLVARRRK